MKGKGFTLVELLVVVAIIAILSVVGTVSFIGIRNRALEAKTKADLDSIRKAYETNYDPTLNGGQGGYKELTDSMFASGKKPTQPNGSPYPVITPIPNSADDSFSYFAFCIDDATKQACQYPGGTCKCTSSSGGTPPDNLSGGSNGEQCDAFNVISEGLVGYWKMDETGWTNDCSTPSVIDSSNSGINGKLCSSAGSTVAAPTAPPAYPLSNSSFGSTGFFTRNLVPAGCWLNYGSALVIGDDTTTTFNLSTFSLSAWVRLTDICIFNLMDQCTILSKDNTYTLAVWRDSDNQSKLALLLGDVRRRGGAPVALVIGGPLQADSQWHHVAATYDWPNAILYVDGVLVQTTLYVNGQRVTAIPSSGFSDLPDFDVPLNIGGRGRAGCRAEDAANCGAGSYCGYQFFPGYIDDVRVYNRVLSENEIQQVKDNAVAPCQ